MQLTGSHQNQNLDETQYMFTFPTNKKVHPFFINRIRKAAEGLIKAIQVMIPVTSVKQEKIFQEPEESQTSLFEDGENHWIRRQNGTSSSVRSI